MDEPDEMETSRTLSLKSLTPTPQATVTPTPQSGLRVVRVLGRDSPNHNDGDEDDGIDVVDA